MAWARRPRRPWGAWWRATRWRARSAAAGWIADELLRIATVIETHPDNAAAVLLGGFVVSAHLVDRVAAVRFDAPAGLRCVLFIPERRLSTEDMRRVLPVDVPLRHAVENLGRVAIGVAGIATGRFELLADLTVDRLHEPYRSVRLPGAASADRRGTRGGGAGRVPVRCGLHDPGLRRARCGQRAYRGGFAR